MDSDVPAIVCELSTVASTEVTMGPCERCKHMHIPSKLTPVVVKQKVVNLCPSCLEYKLASNSTRVITQGTDCIGSLSSFIPSRLPFALTTEEARNIVASSSREAEEGSISEDRVKKVQQMINAEKRATDNKKANRKPTSKPLRYV